MTFLLALGFVFLMALPEANATNFTNGNNTLSVNLANGTFTLNGTTYGPYEVRLRNGGADIEFRQGNTIVLTWTARDGFFQSSVSVEVTVNGQTYNFRITGPGSSAASSTISSAPTSIPISRTRWSAP